MKFKGRFTGVFSRLIIVLLSMVLQVHASAQSLRHYSKISPTLVKQLEIQAERLLYDYILTTNGRELSVIQPGTVPTILRSLKGFLFYNVQSSKAALLAYAELPEVLFLETAARKAKEELTINNLDLSLNRINLLHNTYPLWNGNGQVVSIKENLPDTNDIDLRGRYITTSAASTVQNSHATTMATLIAGAGNSWHLGKGVAWGSQYSSANYEVLLPEPDVHYAMYNISVQNHSYGVGLENFYGADAAAYDLSSINNPSLLHVFSSGNSGNLNATTGLYTGIPGFANLTGSFKMAKNTLVTGATDSFGVVVPLSSRGPAHDGRIKPDLAAFGEDGSSGSAALVSGTSLVMQQAYREINGALPANHLIRSVLINSATDAGNPGPDYSYGFGNLDATRAIATIRQSHFFSGSVTQGANAIFTLGVPAGIKELKITLAWNDRPAAPNAAKALINDLDLQLEGNNQNWQPWVLNAFPHIDSLKKAATRKRDSLNTTEQVTIRDPAAGVYTITVKGYNVTGNQPFSLAYQMDTLDKFEWHFPTSTDHILSGETAIIRWKNSFTSAGALEYSTDNMNWILVDNNVDLSRGYYQWPVPSLIATAYLRMTVAGNQFVSGRFTIAAITPTGVAFNCADSFAFYWNKLRGVDEYRVYELGSRYLQPFLVTRDSFLVLSKAGHPSLHYAVAPIIDNQEAVRSLTFNYTLQGVDCYFSAFLARLLNGRAELDLTLGSNYNLAAIFLEKWNGTSFTAIRQLSPSGLAYHFTDSSLLQGANIYRIRLQTTSGTTAYSAIETIYYFGASEYLLYPNPAPRNTGVFLGVKNVAFQTLQVFNSAGGKILEIILDDRINRIYSPGLDKGIYFIRVLENNRMVYRSSFILF